jgi:2-phosphoglycerate kinase
MDRPMIIYIGGGIGAGKSSLATELASRLDISKVTGTDMIRQIMRTIFTEQMLPTLHSSSFDFIGDIPKTSYTDNTKEGFIAQAVNVNVGVRAMVERAINENINMILEGVHLLPSLIHFEDLANKAYHIPVVISLSNNKSHRARFNIRQKRAFNRKAQRYEEYFERIRQIHDYCIETAGKHGVDIIENEDFDRSINQLVRMVITKLLQQIGSRGKPSKP